MLSLSSSSSFSPRSPQLGVGESDRTLSRTPSPSTPLWHHVAGTRERAEYDRHKEYKSLAPFIISQVSSSVGCAEDVKEAKEDENSKTPEYQAFINRSDPRRPPFLPPLVGKQLERHEQRQAQEKKLFALMRRLEKQASSLPIYHQRGVESINQRLHQYWLLSQTPFKKNCVDKKTLESEMEKYSELELVILLYMFEQTYVAKYGYKKYKSQLESLFSGPEILKERQGLFEKVKDYVEALPDYTGQHLSEEGEKLSEQAYIKHLYLNDPTKRYAWYQLFYKFPQIINVIVKLLCCERVEFSDGSWKLQPKDPFASSTFSLSKGRAPITSMNTVAAALEDKKKQREGLDNYIGSKAIWGSNAFINHLTRNQRHSYNKYGMLTALYEQLMERNFAMDDEAFSFNLSKTYPFLVIVSALISFFETFDQVLLKKVEALDDVVKAFSEGVDAEFGVSVSVQGFSPASIVAKNISSPAEKVIEKVKQEMKHKKEILEKVLKNAKDWNQITPATIDRVCDLGVPEWHEFFCKYGDLVYEYIKERLRANTPNHTDFESPQNVLQFCLQPHIDAKLDKILFDTFFRFSCFSEFLQKDDYRYI